MQTVQFQCGSCGQMMAVGVEHLGSQVHCPHCMEIVQAPQSDTVALEPPQPAEPPIPEIRVPAHEVAEEGSIFSAASDEDLFDAPRGPLVEMPSGPAAAPAPAPILAPPHNISAGPPQPTALAEPASDSAAAPLSALAHGPLSEVQADEAELPAQNVRRPKAANSMLVPMLLILLIPYSLVCTGYIIYTTFIRPANVFDPLEIMRDPKPNDGGPKRVPPEVPLPGKLKTSLNQAIQVGDLEVTPLKVALAGGDLVLYLKMRNLSKDVMFNPLPDSFAHYTERARPYIFLDTGKDKLFGGYVEYRNQPANDGHNRLRPGEENLTLLTSNDKYRPKIAAALKSHEPLLWRVHVRRGFVPVHGKLVSATAVIGVSFTPPEIAKGS